MATILRNTPEGIGRAAVELRNGAVVAVPTETVYGLAGHALNEKACRFIFEIKGRPLIDPLIVHIAEYAQLHELAEVPEDILPMLKNLWPGALTVVLPKKACVPGIVTAGLKTVAIRMPKHPVMRALLQEIRLPLAAPSANPFGYISPTCAEHVQKHLGEKLGFILDGGACEIGLESTIVNLSNPEEWQILRHGPVSSEVIAPCLPERKMLSPKESVISPSENSGQIAPGLLDRHYSPKTPMFLFSGFPADTVRAFSRAAVVFLKRSNQSGLEHAEVFWFSEDGSMESIAHNLFSLLRKLDEGGYDALFVEVPDGFGIGLAINDRLRRAAAKR